MPTKNPFDAPVFLTDGGLETTLIFHQGITLKHFAAFELLKDEAGKTALREYYRPYLDLAAQYATGFVLETPTWRSNPDWGTKLGYTAEALNDVNRESVSFVRDLAAPYTKTIPRLVISGNIGPRGDGYKAENCMNAAEAQKYHEAQVNTFARGKVDVVTAVTINYSDEAIGIVRAAQAAGCPVVISFTVETDGKLPNGESLRDAIEKTDAATHGYALHYMINCAHPDHFMGRMDESGSWKKRIKGLRANASRKSHAELDESETLDAGDRQVLASGYRALRDKLTDLKVIGGCCGTDHSHVGAICEVLLKGEEV